MLRVAFLLFGLVATVFAGIGITVVLMIPAWQTEAMNYILRAVVIGAILAAPVTLVISRQIVSLTGKAH